MRKSNPKMIKWTLWKGEYEFDSAIHYIPLRNQPLLQFFIGQSISQTTVLFSTKNGKFYPNPSTSNVSISTNPDKYTNIDLCEHALWLLSKWFKKSYSFTLTRKAIHTQTALCSTAFVYQRLNWDPTKRGASLHKVSQSFHSIGFLSCYFFLQIELSQQIMHNAHLSQRQWRRLHSVVRAQTWVRANMVLYWLPPTGTFSTGSEIYVFTEKHAQDEYWCQSKALCTAHP